MLNPVGFPTSFHPCVTPSLLSLHKFEALSYEWCGFESSAPSSLLPGMLLSRFRLLQSLLPRGFLSCSALSDLLSTHMYRRPTSPVFPWVRSSFVRSLPFTCSGLPALTNWHTAQAHIPPYRLVAFQPSLFGCVRRHSVLPLGGGGNPSPFSNIFMLTYES